ncbi:MAG: hypothetical protein IH582_13505 [Afipia sp.]|nr:hypothetical protein [Afipia sp.]
MWRPAYQGSLDGLCGLYAMANALWICGYDDGEAVLREAAKGLPKSRWPDALFGTYFADMQRIARHLRTANGFERVRIRFPFARNTPRSDAEYWVRFDALFEQPDARCAIIGIEDPWQHWIVAGPDGTRIQLMDSTAENQLVRKNRKSLHAGSRGRKSAQWLINPRQLILFSLSAEK